MANILQIFLNAFTWENVLMQMLLMFVCRDTIDKKISIGLGNGLVPKRQQAITWTNNAPMMFDAIWCH